MVEDTGATARPSSIRALNLPLLVEVDEDERCQPTRVALERRVRQVFSIDDVWEIIDEWWHPEPIGRRYYKLRLLDGPRITVFRDLVTGLWYRQDA